MHNRKKWNIEALRISSRVAQMDPVTLKQRPQPEGLDLPFAFLSEPSDPYPNRCLLPLSFSIQSNEAPFPETEAVECEAKYLLEPRCLLFQVCFQLGKRKRQHAFTPSPCFEFSRDSSTI